MVSYLVWTYRRTIAAVYKVRHSIFGQFSPLPLSHFVTHSGTPQKYVTHLGPQIFSRPIVQKPGQKPSAQILSQLFAVAFVRGVCQGVLCLEGFVRVVFVRSPFCQNTPVITES